MNKGILLHEGDDDVGVAAKDLAKGDVVQAVTLEGQAVAEIELVDDVPLAHKVAVRPIAAHDPVVEYGRAIGASTTNIVCGAHVHTHNVQSQRWSGRSQIVEHHRESA